MPFLRVLSLAFATLATVFFATAYVSAHAAGVHTVQGDLAVGGYDPVAYFTIGRPTEGSAQFTATHEGATYRFASAANRDAFTANPARYAPQYGGYCAWAIAQGQYAPGRPQHWRIVDGKLYLNFNAQVQRDWEADIPGFIQKANANWPNNVKKRGLFGL